MKSQKLELIGKGLFSKVYRLNETEVLIKSSDWAKECQLLWIESKLVPPLERHGDNDYRMKYYPVVKSLKSELLPDQYELYLQLRAIDRPQPWNYSIKVSYNTPIQPHQRYDTLIAALETLKNEEVKEDLIRVVEYLSNYGQDVMFEISPRNVAVDNGKLILLDCFYFESQMHKVRNAKTTKYQYS